MNAKELQLLNPQISQISQKRSCAMLRAVSA